MENSKLTTFYLYEPSDKNLFVSGLDAAVHFNNDIIKIGSNSAADIRELRKNGDIYLGFLANLRITNLPHLLKINESSERELPKDKDEALGEKSHFLYSKKLNILFFEMNGKAHRNPNPIAEYVTNTINKTVVLNQKFTLDAEKRLSNINGAYKIEFNIASVNPKALKDTPLEQGIKELSKTANKINLTLSNDKRKGRIMDISLKEVWSRLSLQHTTKFKVYSSDLDDPIDMIEERVKFKEEVQTNDGYTVSKSAYEALEKCRQKFTQNGNE